MLVDRYLRGLYQRYPNICYLYAVVGNFFMSTMNIFFKILTALGSPLQILFYRALTIFTINLWILGDKRAYISSSKSASF